MFKRLYNIGYPIRRMELVDRYDANDSRSMAADNTSAFNCRFVAGTDALVDARLRPRDRHQPGREPLRLGLALLAARRRAVRRPLPQRPGMIHDGDKVEKAFARRAGWEWLGDGPQSIRDYQHFSPNGT